MFAVMVRKHFNALLDDGRINHAFYDTTSHLCFLQWSPAAMRRAAFCPCGHFVFAAACSQIFILRARFHRSDINEERLMHHYWNNRQASNEGTAVDTGHDI